MRYRPCRAGGGTAVEVAVPIAPAVTEDDRKQWQEGAPEQWALELLAVVRSQVCRLPVSGEISAKYTEADGCDSD